MTQKRTKYNPNKKLSFDLEKGEYVEKKQYIDSKENPTAIVYVRVSDQKQVDEGSGLESQESTCRRLADSKKITIVKVFQDSAITGRRLDRKGLEEAITYLKEQNRKYPKVHYIVCTEISRISRSEDITQTIEVKKRIESTGVNIITAHNGRNITNENLSDGFMTDFDIIRAKYESLQIGERSLNGSKSKLYEGRWIFHPPVGYERIYVKNGTKTEKLLQMLEPKASIVKEGLELFANGVFVNNSQLLKHFNDKLLESNHHSPKAGKLGLSFVKRLFEIERLYFYAGYILYPNYGVNKPVEAIHQPLITLSTAHKILKRIDKKGNFKFGPRKDTSDLYPLRGVVYCPHCDYPMTGRPSKSGTGKIYYYYGCNRKDCKQKENININDMHKDFEEMLARITPKKGVINLLDGLLQEVMDAKNKVQEAVIKSKQRRIKEIDLEISGFPNTISKLTRIEVIQKIEEKRANLEEEKEILENEVNNKGLNEKDFTILYSRIKNIIEDPLSIWELGSTELKMLLVGVLFGGKLYYKKNEGYQTPHISVLYSILDHIDSGKVTSGAGDATRTRNQLLGRQGL